MTNDILRLARLLQRVERACAQMNRGLAAVAIVLAAVTVFVAACRAVEATDWHGPIARTPFLAMAADAPDANAAPSLYELFGD